MSWQGDISRSVAEAERLAGAETFTFRDTAYPCTAASTAELTALDDHGNLIQFTGRLRVRKSLFADGEAPASGHTLVWRELTRRVIRVQDAADQFLWLNLQDDHA